MLPLPLVTVERNCLCFKEGGRGRASLQPRRQGGERPAPVQGARARSPSSAVSEPHADGDTRACVLSQGHGMFGFFRNTGPRAAATESGAMVFCQFRESLGCQRNHITAIQQMNSNNATALGWPYLYWASQECQDFSIHKKCASGTNYLCHFSSTPQSQMIRIVRKASVFGLACVSPLHRFQ